jgi:hypothetical protein
LEFHGRGRQRRHGLSFCESVRHNGPPLQHGQELRGQSDLTGQEWRHDRQGHGTDLDVWMGDAFGE